MKVFSMFSGIGGFELGLEQSNLEHQLIGFSEIDKYAISIFEQKFQGVKNYGDATTIRGDELPDFDLLVGGFPCQSFSVAGLQKGFGDTRGTLFFDIARICSEKRPRYLVLENVRGLLSHDGGKTFQTILRVLADLGYGVEWQVLNSKNFGVPQNRERVFIVGYLGGRSGRQIFPIAREVREASVAKVRQENLVDIIDKKGKSKNKKVASTLAGGAHSGGNHSDMDLLVTFGAGLRIRRLTPTECERLQGFPDGWTEGLSDTQRYKTLGNAVTVNVVEAVMNSFAKVEEIG